MGAFPSALYSSLISDLSDNVGYDFSSNAKLTSIWPDASYKEWCSFTLAQTFFKKLKPRNCEVQDSAALYKFLQVNLACENWKLELETSWDEVLIGELRRTLWDFYYDDAPNTGGPHINPIAETLDDCLPHGRCGPGAAVGALGGDFYTKMFASPMSSTSQALYISYRNYIRHFPEWSSAEIIRQEHFGSVQVVKGNRLSFVPKNETISRVICIEPSLNMFFQLGLGRLIERRLYTMFGISMEKQPFKNRELARLGSLYDHLSTIDLSSASDSMSLSMLRCVLPKPFMGLLEMLRSKECDVPGVGQMRLNMISTMGNGFTFPLQTMLFASCVVAAARSRGFRLEYPRGNDNGNFGVFGDDIICHREITRDVLRLLKLLGFVTNNDKTFVEGPFRESCGSDFFLGRNIRGVYVKSLDTQQDFFAVINQLNRFSTRTGITLRKTVRLLMRRCKWTPVPRWDDDSSGLKVPHFLANFRLDRNGSALYWRYEPVGKRIRIGEGAIFVPSGAKRRIYNPSGLYISFLQRSINSSAIAVRHDNVRWKRKLGCAPNWDALPKAHLLEGWFNWQRWDTAVYLNLFG